MDKQVVDDKFFQIIHQFNVKKITSKDFDSILLNKIHSFHDRNGRTCKILLANDDIIRQNI